MRWSAVVAQGARLRKIKSNELPAVVINELKAATLRNHPRRQRVVMDSLAADER